jgi:Cu2+-exporting ATPase
MGRRETGVVEVTLRECFCATELHSLEPALRKVPGVTGVLVDRTRSVVHVRYDPIHASADSVRHRVHELGYRCECVGCPDSCSQPGHPAVGVDDARITEHRHGHETVGEHDMGGGEAGETPGGHDAHAGHGAEMVSDMLRRLIVSAVLAVPIVLFSRSARASASPSDRRSGCRWAGSG